MAYGFGQTPSPVPCGLFDQWMGTCVENPETDAETQGSYQCNYLQQLIWPSSCASAATSTPAPPTLPGGGAATVVSVDPDTGSITTLSPAEQQAANVAAIQAQAQANAPVDCTQWYNQLFSPKCPCSYCTSLGGWAGIAVVGVIAFLALKGLAK